MTQRLEEIMTKVVATVRPDQPIRDAAKIMHEYNVGIVPVVENGQCVGMLTDRDIVIRATSSGRDGNTPISNIMTKNVVTASSQMDVHQAANLMAQHQIRRLPVVDNNQLNGIVSLGDLAVEEIYENEAGDALSNISLNDNYA
ncbi:CBS domain-containing protein [Aneurinibacillus sp. Ricciae_BoGa-3]|uniref:CBS domain-containing protein n=1 Tax=Aneurinibacillus sp. Ricciae_BoGa-3 TaxID=3022697 RepID=UPI00233F944A|nr:CBS domain-containing protein [Aneurinibacillus sp. Ricciae_BoGa-3]WCK55754.1 CBS domain-containing protein [Aneurinibacillus sp. Ricciae_BoGa-3]